MDWVELEIWLGWGSVWLELRFSFAGDWAGLGWRFSWIRLNLVRLGRGFSWLWYKVRLG